MFHITFQWGSRVRDSLMVGILSGGTGKYANVTGTCSYQLAAFDKESLVGLITLQCTDNQ